MSRPSLVREGWHYICLIHTVSGDNTDRWCDLLAAEAGLRIGEVDWSSYAGRHVIRCAREREAVVEAVLRCMDSLRDLYRQACLQFNSESLQHAKSGEQIGIMLTEDGVMIDEASLDF